MSTPPQPLVIDEDAIVCQCLEGDGGAYVDIHVDSIPLEEGDLDYSEDPDLLRRLAAWIEEAADWLEANQ